MTQKKDPKDHEKIGRPTAYRPEMCEEVDDYIKDCLTVEEGKERVLPSRCGIAIKFNVSVVTIGTWRDKYPDFLRALEKIDTAQRFSLINRGMNGTGNSTITKLLLSHNHGMKERTDITSDNEKVEMVIPKKYEDI